MARRLGRPPLDPTDPSTELHLHLPSKLYDDTCKLAQRHGVSVPEVVRRVLRVALKHAPDPPR